MNMTYQEAVGIGIDQDKYKLSACLLSQKDSIIYTKTQQTCRCAIADSLSLASASSVCRVCRTSTTSACRVFRTSATSACRVRRTFCSELRSSSVCDSLASVFSSFSSSSYTSRTLATRSVPSQQMKPSVRVIPQSTRISSLLRS